MRFWLCALFVCLIAASAAEDQKRPPPARDSGIERAVEEFKIQTRNFGIRPDSPAKKSGNGVRREYHGRLYENFRNDFLDAVPHQIRQRGGTKSLLRRNQFGFNVAGPVYLPKIWEPRATFFSVSYEGVRERISRTNLRTVPTMAERTGDWSHVVDQAGELLPIYDPRTTKANPAYDPSRPVSVDNLQYLREPFPANRIPEERLDPVAQRALAYYPAPNASAGPFYRNNFFINSPETNTANGMIAKVDHAIRNRHRLSSEFAFSNGLEGAADWFPSIADPGPTDRSFQSRSGKLEHVFTASPNIVNTMTFDVSASHSENQGASAGSDTGAAIGLRGIAGQSFPIFNLGPYVSMGRSYPVSSNARTTYLWSNGLAWRAGSHSLQMVGRFTRYHINTYWPQYPAGSFRFGSGLTSLPGIVNTGHQFASFLLGYAEYAERSVVISPSYFRKSHSGLVLRDRYELRKDLSLSLALNVEYSTPRVEKYNRQSTVDLSVTNPANGRNGALVAAGRDGYGRSFQPARFWAEPSLSLAWNPVGDPKSVVRASFSRYYNPIPIYNGQWGTQGFTASATHISPNVQLEPAVILSEGLPPLATTLPDLRREAANDTVADLVDRSGRLPTYQSASLTVEREFPGSTVISTGFYYAGGKNLLVSNQAANPNAIHPDYLAYRDLLNDESFNRSLRPYPQYKGFDVYSAYPIGRYQRNQFAVRVEKRASRGLYFNLSYDFSRQMDDYSGPFGKQDFFNRENEWSRTAYNQPHRLSFGYTYELPIGSNKPFLQAEDWKRHLLDGWSVTGTGSVRSGDPLYVRPQFNNTGGVIQALRVNVVPGVDPHVPDQSPHLWFNPSAFAQPPDFTLGNGPRTHPTLLNPGSQNYDLTLNKRFVLSSARAVEFNAAAFNVVNHANWDNPDNVIGPADAPNVNAGRIAESSGGRVIQLGLRFSF